SRPRGIRLASSPFAPAGGDTRGGRNARSCRPTCESPSSGLTAPRAGFSRAVVLAVLGVEPLDLGGELRGLAGQFPGELQRRVAGLAVGDGERDRGGSGGDVEDRAVVVVGVQERPPVLTYVQADLPERS